MKHSIERCKLHKNTYGNSSTFELMRYVIYLKKIETEEEVINLISDCELWNVAYYSGIRTMYADVLNQEALNKLLDHKLVVRLEKNLDRNSPKLFSI